MNIEQSGKNLILHGVKDFYISHTFDCGQCFRWDRLDSCSYIGVAMGKALKIRQIDDKLIFFDTNFNDYYDVWEKYLDLSRDYGKIKRVLSTNDSILAKSVRFGGGIHILRQDAWECMISFIVSSSNNIPRIKKIIASLAENFGGKIEYMGNVYHSFPAPQALAKLSLDELSVIRAGFRDKYILAAAKAVASGRLDIYGLDSLPLDKAKAKLLEIPGIGNKVADCILLYGLAKYECFPVDVWMKRIMEYYYFQSERKISDVVSFSREKFGSLSGFAQQYLFFYGRENKIGTSG